MSDIPEDEPSNVIQAFGMTMNPAIALQSKGAECVANQKAMLSQLEIIREQVEAGRVSGLVVLGQGAPGHVDLHWVSEAMHDTPASTVGLLEFAKLNYMSEILSNTSAAYLDDED